MADKKMQKFVSSNGDDMDSANEAFVFTQKRKVNSFFMDLTEHDSKSKKQKTKNTVDTDVDVTPSDGARENVRPDGTAEPEVQVVKFVRGDCSKFQGDVRCKSKWRCCH